jgi:hypothetical protein
MSIKNVTQLNDFAMLRGERIPRNRRAIGGCAECDSALSREEIIYNNIDGETFCDHHFDIEKQFGHPVFMAA